MSRTQLKMFALIISSMPIGLMAQELSLQNALSEWQGSPKLQRATSQKEEASWKKIEAYSGFLPRVEVHATHYLEQQFIYTDIKLNPSAPATAIPGVVPTTIYGVGLVMPLFDGFANINRLDAAKAGEAAGVSELNWTSFQGQREVIVLFYKALAAQILKDVAAQNLKALEDHLHDTELFKKAGISTKFDVLRIEVQASEARSELMNTTDNERAALIRLGEALGKEMESRKLAGSLPVFKEDLLEAKNEDATQRLDLLALRQRTEAIEDLSHASSKHFIPKINFIAGYDKYNNRTSDLTGSAYFRNSYSLGVQLTWNIFDGLSSNARDKQLIEQSFQAKKTLQIASIKAKNDVDFWKRKFHYNSIVYQSRLNDIKKSDESVRLAKEGRAVGTRTNSDFLDAEAELFRARAGAVNAQIGTIEALVNFELATGNKVYEF